MLSLRVFRVLHVVLAVAVAVAVAGAGGQPRPQPQPQPQLRDIDVLRRCCELGSEEAQLLQCANASAHAVPKTGEGRLGHITLFSYSTANIFDYGSYSLAVNTAFAQHHGMQMRLLTPQDGANFEPHDPRWNKVQILLQALDQPTMEGTEAIEYAVWIDTDLIFLDFGLQLEGLLAEHSTFDMIFSADPVMANGVVNSGCVVARNTPWTRNFLRRWWSRFDRTQGMDQHAFSRLWEEEQNDGVSEHIKILSTYAINSHIPSWKYQQPHHPVLHLAGESNVLRTEVFREGWQALCQHNSRNERLPTQLGLSRERLQSLRQSLPLSVVVEQVVEEMYSKTDKTLPLVEIKQLFARLQDILQVGLDNIHDPAIRTQLLVGIRWTVEATKKASLLTRPGSREELEAVQAVLDSFFNYIVLFSQVDQESYLRDGEDEFHDGEKWVNRLQTLVVPRDKGAALYFQFKLHDMAATLHKQRRDVPRMLVELEKAANVWMRMHQLKSYGSGNGVMNPFSEVQGILLNIAAFSCDSDAWNGNVAQEIAHRGLQASYTSLGFFEETWGHKLELRRGGEADAWVPAAELGEQAIRLYYAGNCAMELGQEKQAFLWYEESLAALRVEEELIEDEARGAGLNAVDYEVEQEATTRRLTLSSAVHSQLHLLAGRIELSNSHKRPQYMLDEAKQENGQVRQSRSTKKMFRRRKKHHDL